METAMVEVRPPRRWEQPSFASTSMSNNPNHTVTIRHPAHPATGGDVLLTLRATDHPTGGLYHETARTICGIVVGNIWNGYFSETAGGQPLSLDPEALIASGTYFFHVPHPAGVDIGFVFM